MTDIVERLRFWATKKPDLLPAIACGEAADEIERLQQELAIKAAEAALWYERAMMLRRELTPP